MTAITTETLSGTRINWLKRVGIAGFWFFFIKGMLWVAAPFVFYFLM